MKLLLIFIFANYCITRQNATSGESFSQVVKLFNYADKQILEIKSYTEAVVESFSIQMKKLINEMQEESATHIRNGLEIAESKKYPDGIEIKMNDCTKTLNDTIEEDVTHLFHLIELHEQMVDKILEKLKSQQPFSSDLDEINDEIDDILDYFKENFDLKITDKLDAILSKIKKNSILITTNIKKCIDDVIKAFS